MMTHSSYKYIFKQTKLLALYCVFSAGLFILSCDREEFSTDPNHLLEFSADTLDFESSFAGIKSSTKRFLVLNPYEKAVRISRISLAQGKNSAFQLNVDGESRENSLFTNVEIPSKDFIYIFTAIKSKNQSEDSPTPIEDAILFDINGGNQKIVLKATTQNVEELKAVKILSDTILSAKKPYIIYDSLYLAPDKTLTLEAGCKLYFHNNAKLVVHGTIRAEGSIDRPIELRGDRFDNVNFDIPLPYNYMSGQWDGVYLHSPKGESVFKNVNINSAYVGIYFDNSNLSVGSVLPSVTIENCRIHNFHFYGLYLQNVDATVINSEISNSAGNTVYLSGGKHTFVHSSIANYYNSGTNIQAKNREYNQAALLLKESAECPSNTSFFNCVIAGSSTNELSIDSKSANNDNFKVYFSHSYIKKSEENKLPSHLFNQVLFSKKEEKPIFKNIDLIFEKTKKEYYNFEPDSLSPIRNLASSSIIDSIAFANYNLATDLNGRSRKVGLSPDAGAYQWFLE